MIDVDWSGIFDAVVGALSSPDWNNLASGLAGALLGAVVAAWATLRVARWQAREQLRQGRLQQLEELVVRMLLKAKRFSQSELHDGEAVSLDDVIDEVGLAHAQASAVVPRFATALFEVLNDLEEEESKPAVHEYWDSDEGKTVTDDPGRWDRRTDMAYRTFLLGKHWLQHKDTFEEHPVSYKDKITRNGEQE